MPSQHGALDRTHDQNSFFKTALDWESNPREHTQSSAIQLLEHACSAHGIVFTLNYLELTCPAACAGTMAHARGPSRRSTAHRPDIQFPSLQSSAPSGRGGAILSGAMSTLSMSSQAKMQKEKRRKQEIGKRKKI